MTALREAAQQALEALGSDNPDIQLRAAIALRAALAQPDRAQKMRDAGYTRRPTLREMAEPEPTPCPDCGKPLIGVHTCSPQQPAPEPVAWQDWWENHGKHNLRATPIAISPNRAKELMKLAFEVGREARPQQPAPEPVAWMHTDAYKLKVRFLEWGQQPRGYRGDWIKTPLYTAPPQRKPLSEEEMCDIAERCGCLSADWVDFARAIEAAHGIKEDV